MAPIPTLTVIGFGEADSTFAREAGWEAAGGRFVDVALLAQVDPARLNVPLLVLRASADEAVAALSAAGFAKVRSVGAEVGRASAIKMIRSVMVKGVEALTAE